jgi:serine-type D-Ala-D-Ala carboxypeptidase/endopeptidase (penicillin-binding protein 4)
MRKVFWFIGFLAYWFAGEAQTVDVKLSEAVQQLEKDPQMRHAIAGLAVIDAKTGRLIYGRNEQIGLAAASTQKILTSIASFELLGKDYKYKTQLAYSGKIKNGILNGHLYVIGAGDPSLGSWRYAGIKDSLVLKEWVAAVKSAGIKKINGTITTNESAFSHQAIPDGWIWQDIGNYYGAGAYQLNWKENQYDLILKSGDNINDSVTIVNEEKIFPEKNYVNELKAAAKGSGDNAYVYLPTAKDRNLLITGTIPVGEKAFSISGALPDPVSTLLTEFSFALKRASVSSEPGRGKGRDIHDRDKNELAKLTYFHSHYSPPLDSINYWFMRRSINLYGEALIKTIAHEKAGYGNTDTGLRVVRDFWADNGIDKAAINIIDGSGLSPQNRVTADALAHALQFAKTRPWFESFYVSLPTYNNMKLKSGSIGGARAFAGYHTSAQGAEYIVAIILNNYSGSSGEIVKKMYKILDVLK